MNEAMKDANPLTLDDADDSAALVLPRPTLVDDLDRWNLAPVLRRSRRPLEVSF